MIKYCYRFLQNYNIILCLNLMSSGFYSCYACALAYLWFPNYILYRPIDLYRVSEKTVQNCFCQNFIKFPSILELLVAAEIAETRASG